MLYSGKFSLGANFHDFLGLISNCENMNHGKKEKQAGQPARNFNNVIVMHVYGY